MPIKQSQDQLKSVIDRLSIIKYIFNKGLEQSNYPFPACSMSLLLLHDAVEMFLFLAAEVNSAQLKSNCNFVDYWDALEKVLGKNIPSDRTSIGIRLNKARVGLKHLGITLPKEEILNFCTTVRSFFLENTTAIFDIDFEAISFSDLIHADKVKKALIASGEHWKGNNKKLAVESLADAFYEINLSFIIFINKYCPSLYSEIPRYGGIGSILEDVTYELVKMTVTHNFIDYLRFKSLTPTILDRSENRPGNYKYSMTYNIENVTSKDYDFCCKFIIDTAINLQEVVGKYNY